jgi:hypothetical protein
MHNLSVIKSPTLELCLPSSKSRIKNIIHLVIHIGFKKNVMQIFQVKVQVRSIMLIFIVETLRCLTIPK